MHTPDGPDVSSQNVAKKEGLVKESKRSSKKKFQNEVQRAKQVQEGRELTEDDGRSLR